MGTFGMGYVIDVENNYMEYFIARNFHIYIYIYIFVAI